jgi:hypothetical protein
MDIGFPLHFEDENFEFHDLPGSAYGFLLNTLLRVLKKDGLLLKFNIADAS